MLVRWPSHGPTEVPDLDALVQTLDTFWRFLRGTGRMALASAEPKALVKEARRAAPRMPGACADRTRHGAAKSLTAYGERIGISLEGAESMEELGERLQAIMDSWNDLPEEQRKAAMPISAGHGSIPGAMATELLAGMGEDPYAEDEDEDEDDWMTGLPVDEEGMVPPADPELVAQQVQASPFVQQCLRLADWVGEEREVTDIGVLRPALAREAYAALDLWSWERGRDRARFRSDLAQGAPEVEEYLRDLAMRSFRSAIECEPLDRLWTACEASGMIDIGRTKAAAAPRELGSAHDWVQLGLAALSTLALRLEGTARLSPVLGVLLPLLMPDRERISQAEVCDWWWGHQGNIHRLAQHLGEEARSASDAWLDASLWQLEDTGVWRRDGDWLYATELGHDFALLVVGMLDRGILEV